MRNILLGLGIFASVLLYGPIMGAINDAIPHSYGSIRDVGIKAATPTAHMVISRDRPITGVLVTVTVAPPGGARLASPSPTSRPGNPVMTPNPGWRTPPAQKDVWPIPKK
jgi:hypothetical protein